MNHESSKRIVLVPLPISFVEAVIDMCTALDDELKAILEKTVSGAPPSEELPLLEHYNKAITPGSGRYVVEFLGVSFSANTLPDVFGKIVDMTEDVAPDVLVYFAEHRTRKRRYISLNADEVTPHSRHLSVMKTASGWWISKNISQSDLIRALRTLCKISGLKFGKDLKFSLK